MDNYGVVVYVFIHLLRIVRLFVYSFAALACLFIRYASFVYMFMRLCVRTFFYLGASNLNK